MTNLNVLFEDLIKVEWLAITNLEVEHAIIYRSVRLQFSDY